MADEKKPFDPNAEEYKSERTPRCTVGKRLLTAVGYERYPSSKKGTRMLDIRFVCLFDVDGTPEENEIGHHYVHSFVAEGKGLSFFAEFVRDGLGHNEPFDLDDDKELEAVLTKGHVWAELAQDNFGDAVRVKAVPGTWAPYKGKPELDLKDGGAVEKLIDEAVGVHNDYIEWRSKPGNSRKERAETYAAKRASGGGGGGGGARRGGGGADDDGDIPF